MVGGRTRAEGGDGGSLWWLIVAGVVQLGLAVFPFAFTGLLAPVAGVLAAYALWLAAAAWLLLRRPRHPAALLAPVLSLAAWFVLLTLGDVLLGWTA